MKVLLLNGSTRKNGCTYLALSEVAKALNTEGIETEIVQMGGGAVRDCIGCNGCAGKGQCVFGDDMVNEMIAKARRRSHSYTVPIDRIFYRLAAKPTLLYRVLALGVFCLFSNKPLEKATNPSRRENPLTRAASGETSGGVTAPGA